MQFNIHSGRLRYQVDIKRTPTGPDSTDEYGQPLPPVTVFSARADVEIKSGSQNVEMGQKMTDQVITCLMWYDVRAKNSDFITFEDDLYEIQHINRDEEQNAMIITATVKNP